LCEQSGSEQQGGPDPLSIRKPSHHENNRQRGQQRSARQDGYQVADGRHAEKRHAQQVRQQKDPERQLGPLAVTPSRDHGEHEAAEQATAADPAQILDHGE